MDSLIQSINAISIIAKRNGLDEFSRLEIITDFIVKELGIQEAIKLVARRGPLKLLVSLANKTSSSLDDALVGAAKKRDSANLKFLLKKSNVYR